jgi:hypothetical protein
MYPKEHAITSTAAVLLYAIASGVDAPTTSLWAAIAVVSTIAIDVDHLLVLLARGDFSHIRMFLADPFVVFRSPAKIKDEIYFKGFGGIRLVSHSAVIATAYLVSERLAPNLTAPLMLSLIVHCALDVWDYIENPQDR